MLNAGLRTPWKIAAACSLWMAAAPALSCSAQGGAGQKAGPNRLEGEQERSWLEVAGYGTEVPGHEDAVELSR